MSELFGALGASFVMVAISAVFALLFRAMITLAVAEDCKAIGVKNRVLWILLTLFIPLCAIIYVCVRNSLEKDVPKYCIRCGATAPPNSNMCYTCGSTAMLDYYVSDAPKHKKNSKTFLIIGIVSYVLFIFTYIGTFGVLFGGIADGLLDGDWDNGYGIEEFDEDFGKDFGEEFSDDFDEFAKDFSDSFH